MTGVTNPDVTQSTIGTTICVQGWTAKVRAANASTINALRARAGATSAQEWDHFISLELGGAPADPKNLWAENYTTSIPDGGAHTKDQTENALKRAICNGTLTLAQAQHIITSDWYAYHHNAAATPSYGSIGVTDQDDE